MTQKFTHLHVHSHYSLLDGLSKIDDLLDRVEELNMDAIALTDHGNLYGAVEFYMKAKERGITPIIGCEVYVAPHGRLSKNNTREDKTRNHLILLVQNETGYKNLMKLITFSYLEGFYYKPRIDHALLEKYHDGLIALSGCANGEVAKAITDGNVDKARDIALWYRELFGAQHYYFEMQDHAHADSQNTINATLKKLSTQLDIPLVATADSHYIHPEDSAIQDILLCIQTNRKVHETDRMNLTDFDLSLRTPEDMADAFADTPEAIANTQKIVDLCKDFELRIGETQLPYFPLPAGKDANTYLRELCDDGLTKRYPDATHVTTEHRERMDYELDIIATTGYASYFLIVADFVSWAKDQEIIVGPGRGSAAGSFVSYLVGITNIDPIEYKLLFERFLNPERVSMPDVDLDFADDRRDEVLAYVREKYGEDHVAQIITFGTMAARAAIRDAGRALGLPYDFCDKTAKLIPMFTSIGKTLETIPEFKNLYAGDPDAKQLIDAAIGLEGVARHASVHACGVVITDKPVVEYSPLQYIPGKDDSVVTQYASSTKYSVVEKIGLLKMDFLGLSNLTIIQNTLKIVERIHGEKINIDDIPLDDKDAFAVLQSGRTTGIFQLESSGMRRYLKMLKPTVLEDVIAMVALYRPGPMEWIPDFIAGKHGEREVTYLHPKLENILADTYGVAIYQEQVMKIAQELAGFTLGEADILRKAMGKKILSVMKEQKEKFVIGCIKNGVDKHVGEQIFTFIEPFAGYGFNRSHAACYGLIGYQTAYLKAHYPAEFMAALMTSDQGNTDRIAIDAAECREMGIEVLPPDVNESFEKFAVIYDPDDTEKTKPRIRFGLNAIKNVGHTVAHEIILQRNRNGAYKDLSDFLARANCKDLNKRSVEALAMVGAFDAFVQRNQVVENIESVIAFCKELSVQAQTNQGSLFGTEMLAKPTVTLRDVRSATKKQKLDWEKQLLGLYVSDHPASDFAAYLSDATVSIARLKEDKDLIGRDITVGGIIVAVKKILTKKGQAMLFVNVEDLTGQTEVIVFPRLLEETQELWTEGRPVVLQGNLSDKNDEVKFLASTAKEITEAEQKNAQRVVATKSRYGVTPEPKQIPKKMDDTPTSSKKVTITLPATGTVDMIEEIKKALDTCHAGDTQIYLSHDGALMKTSYAVAMDDDCRTKITDLVGESALN